MVIPFRKTAVIGFWKITPEMSILVSCNIKIFKKNTGVDMFLKSTSPLQQEGTYFMDIFSENVNANIMFSFRTNKDRTSFC